MVLDTATRPPQARGPAWSTSVDIDLDHSADVVVEHQAMALSALVVPQPDRQPVAQLARTVRYIQPALVLVAAVVWLHVLTVTAHALM